MTSQLDQLNALLPSLIQQYYRLILITGPHGTGKTRLLKQLGDTPSPGAGPVPYLNVNLHLSQPLLELTSKQRPLRVRRILTEIIGSYPEPILALDNIELLFEPSLQQDPLALLKELSRNKSLIVAWGGAYEVDRRRLTYAEPGHPEYRRYEQPDVPIVSL